MLLWYIHGHDFFHFICSLFLGSVVERNVQVIFFIRMNYLFGLRIAYSFVGSIEFLLER